ncbi:MULTISPECIES: phosphotransferase [Streptomyces]|uniref:phosphotransferase n=1 Tax=Streptomyces TaxID=1883 RepID=UPI0004CC6847|nr:aminoglycoside phosphotransferase family protein [Streptomyces sp. NRRL F-2890]
MSSHDVPELPHIPERTDPVIARQIVADANHTHGTSYHLVEPMNAGFQAGTWLLHNRENERAVLKWSPNRGSAQQILRAADAVERARDAGYPTPAWLAVGIAKSGFPYHIQQYVPGSSPRRLTAEVAERLLTVLEQQRGLDVDPEHCWSRYARNRLAGEWDHARQAVADSGGEGRRFVAALDALVASFGQVELPSEDLVHGDFRLDNVLLRWGRVVAVIDIEALGSGTRAFDYATLLTVDDMDRTGWDLTRAAGEQVAGPGVLAHCFTLVALDLVDFVRQRNPARLPLITGPLTDRAAALLP